MNGQKIQWKPLKDILDCENKSWTVQDTFPECVAKGSCFLSWSFLRGLGVVDCLQGGRFCFAGQYYRRRVYGESEKG